MQIENLAKRLQPSIDRPIIGFDTETFLIDETGQTPRLVCGTFALKDIEPQSLYKDKLIQITQDQLDKTLILNAQDTVGMFKNLILNTNYIIAIHNAKFDLLVLEKEDPSILPFIVKGLKDGRIVCTQVAQAMMNAALACQLDTRTVSLLDCLKPMLSAEKYKQLSLIKKGMKEVDDESIGQHSLLDEEDQVSSKKVKTVKDKSIRTGYGDLVDVPFDQWQKIEIDYAKEDALFVKALFFMQWSKSSRLNAKGIHFLEDLCRQTYVDFVLAYASTNTGFYMDEYTRKILDQNLAIKERELGEWLVDKGIMTFDRKSNKFSVPQLPLRDFYSNIYDKLNVQQKDRKKTNKNGISTDEEATENLLYWIHKNEKAEELKNEIDILNNIVEYKDIAKQRSTYLKNFTKAVLCDDHRLRFRFQGYGAATGRTTSSEPNLQNLPRSGSVRHCLRAEQGSILGLCDYSNAEMRTLSQNHIDEGRKSLLAEKYKENPHFDPHLFVSASFCGVSYEDAQKYYADKSHPLYKDLKEKRNLAKVLNFGLAGGLGGTAFISYAKGYGFKGDNILKSKDVDIAIRDWRQVYPEMTAYFNSKTSNEPNEHFLNQIHFKKIPWDYDPPKATHKFSRSNRYRFCDSYTNACNTPFQGMASDGAKNALIMVFEECLFEPKSPLFGCRIVNFIHDEIIIEIPVDDIDDNHYTAQGKAAVDRLSLLMKQGMEIITPDIQAVCETTLSYRWDKEAYSPIKGDKQQVYVSKIDQKN